jgi:hypothetical protein
MSPHARSPLCAIFQLKHDWIMCWCRRPVYSLPAWAVITRSSPSMPQPVPKDRTKGTELLLTKSWYDSKASPPYSVNQHTGPSLRWSKARRHSLQHPAFFPSVQNVTSRKEESCVRTLWWMCECSYHKQTAAKPHTVPDELQLCAIGAQILPWNININCSLLQSLSSDWNRT